jgi:hypothetical protein
MPESAKPFQDLKTLSATPESTNTQEPKPDDDGVKAPERPSPVVTQPPEITGRSLDMKMSVAPREAGSDPISNSLRTQPRYQTIVNQNRHTIYSSPGDQALYGTATTFLVAVENELLMSWSNGTSAPQTYSQSYSTGFKSTTGTEVSASISLAPSFEGVSIGGVEVGVKTFSSTETEEVKSHTTTVTVPADSDVFFYQRKYYLNTDVYFTLDAWNELSIAGSNGGYHIQRSSINSTIFTKDYVTRTRALTGTQTLGFDTEQQQGYWGDHVRKFENLTQRAKDKLRSMGIDGSQQG